MNILEIVNSTIDRDVDGSIKKLKAYKLLELQKNIIENSGKGYNKKERLNDIKMAEPIYRNFIKEIGIPSLFKANKSPETITVNKFIENHKNENIDLEMVEEQFGDIKKLSIFNRNKLYELINKKTKKPTKKIVHNGNVEYEEFEVNDLISNSINNHMKNLSK